MKKFLSVLLTAAMLLTFCALFTGCGTKAASSDAASTGASSDAGAASQTETGDFKVGAIYINSKNDTAGYTYAHHKGLTTAMKALGLDPDKDLVIVDNVAEDDNAVGNAIDTLVNANCKIIFGISFGYLTAMDAKAKAYPDVIFSHATGYLSNETNFNNYFGRIYQARYLAGIAAGLKSLEQKNNNIGYVAAYGTEYAETCSGINAFTLGVQAVNPDAVVHVNTINGWANEELEKSLAEDLIDNYNCIVVAQHCDSAQPQLAAQAKGVFGCGYNSDMTVDAPKAHLTAPIWNWNVYYQTAIEAAMKDPQNFVKNVGNYYGGLKEGLVDISPLSDNCAAGTKEATEAVRALIDSGEWDVFSGVKLAVSSTDYKVTKADADLVDSEGNVIVKAGGASVEDAVIQGSMNYYVKGVVQHNNNQ